MIGSNDKIVEYMRHVRAAGMKVVPPDINLSDSDFRPVDGTIVFGLSGMRGVGTKAVEKIIEARNKVGRFKGFMHFLDSVDLSHVGKAVLESMIKGGVFDSLTLNRHSLLEGVERALKVAAEGAADRARGQKGMFAAPAAQDPEDEAARDKAALPDMPPFTEAELQRYEKETFGLYITSSPLESYRPVFEKFAKDSAAKLRESGAGGAVIMGGLINALNISTIKNENSRSFGKQMARFDLVDETGITKVTVFPDLLEKHREVIAEDAPVLVRGMAELQGDDEDQVTISVLAGKIVHVRDAETQFEADESLKYDAEFKLFTTTSPEDLPLLEQGARVRIGGVIAGLRAGKSKKGNEYATFNLSTPRGGFRVLVFGELADAWAGKLREGMAKFAIGEPTVDNDGRYNVKAAELIHAAAARAKFTGGVCVTLTSNEVSGDLLGRISQAALAHHGPTPLYFKIVGETGDVVELVEAAPDFRVQPTREFETLITSMLPIERIEYSAS
jgi:DNA polymerase III alpha subunit